MILLHYKKHCLETEFDFDKTTLGFGFLPFHVTKFSNVNNTKAPTRLRFTLFGISFLWWRFCFMFGYNMGQY